MSEARRIRVATRLAWNAILAGFRQKGVDLEAWPAEGGPQPRAYSIQIPAHGLTIQEKQDAVVGRLYAFHLKLMGELERAKGDTIFVKQEARAELLAHEIRLTAVVGFAKMRGD